VKSQFYGDHSGINLAAFSQFEIEPLHRLKTVAGIRIEHNALDGENDRPVPIVRLGINWQASDYTFIRGSFGQGYRYPSIAEKFASTTLGSVLIIPNPSIQPESGFSSEIGIKQGIGSGMIKGQADLSIFLLQNKDIIEFEFGFYPEGRGFRATNVEQSRVYGSEVEFMLSREFGKVNASLIGGYTYIYPIEYNSLTGKNTDTYLKYRRKHSSKINVLATMEKIDIDISILFKSKTLNIDNVFLDPTSRESILPGFYDYWLENNRGYVLMDGSVGYKINKFRISFAVKNITNTEYMGRPGDIQPHRNFSVRFTGNF
jgi:iron complex outermembrane receptor protein